MEIPFGHLLSLPNSHVKKAMAIHRPNLQSFPLATIAERTPH